MPAGYCDGAGTERPDPCHPHETQAPPHTWALSPERPNALVEDTSHHGGPTGPHRDGAGGSCWRRLVLGTMLAKTVLLLFGPRGYFWD